MLEHLERYGTMYLYEWRILFKFVQFPLNGNAQIVKSRLQREVDRDISFASLKTETDSFPMHGWGSLWSSSAAKCSRFQHLIATSIRFEMLLIIFGAQCWIALKLQNFCSYIVFDNNYKNE